jgi:phosphate uptake regulator
VHVRKLVKAGPSSHTVALPKDWLTRNGLKKGDTLFIHERSDRELVVSTGLAHAMASGREITIPVDGKDLDAVRRAVTSAYINNYASIVLAGNSVSELAKDLHAIIQDFVALEVTEQTATRLAARDLLNLDEISIEQTARRMDMIVRSMLQDTMAGMEGKDLAESISFRDGDVNRLYFLLYRLIKAAIRTPGYAERLKVTGSEALGWLLLAQSLEAIADHDKQITKSMRRLKADADLAGLKELCSQLDRSYQDALKAFYANDLGLAEKVCLQHTRILDAWSKYYGKQHDPPTAEIGENAKAMLGHITNIARAALDRDAPGGSHA